MEENIRIDLISDIKNSVSPYLETAYSKLGDLHNSFVPHFQNLRNKSYEIYSYAKPHFEKTLVQTKFYFENSKSLILKARQDHLKNYTDLEVTLSSILALIILFVALKIIKKILGCGFSGNFFSFSFLKKSNKVQLEDERQLYIKSLQKHHFNPIKTLPYEGYKKKMVSKKIEEMAEKENESRTIGKYSNDIFIERHDVIELANEAAKNFLLTNMAEGGKSISTRQMVSEIVSWTKDLLKDGYDPLNSYKVTKSDLNITGKMTNNFFESILLALMAHKKYF